MSENFEQSLAHETVRAVERRWEHEEETRRIAARRKLIGNIASVLVILAGAFVAVIFVLPRFGIDIVAFDGFSLGGLKEKLFAKEGSADMDAVAHYAKAVELFTFEKSALWRDAPARVKPSTAEPGTTCHVLIMGGRGRYDIYEVTSAGGGGAVVKLLTPFARPSSTTLAELGSRCKGKACFVAHGGVIYAAGIADEAAAIALARRFKAEMSTFKGNKKGNAKQ